MQIKLVVVDYVTNTCLSEKKALGMKSEGEIKTNYFFERHCYRFSKIKVNLSCSAHTGLQRAVY